MAKDDGGGRWAIVISTAAAALISAGAALGAAAIASHSSARTQEMAFQQERVLADRDELRNVLDQSVVALDDAFTELGRVKVAWKARGAPLREPPRRFTQAVLDLSRNTTRLEIRRGSKSELWRTFNAASNFIIDAELIARDTAPNTSATSEVENLQARAITERNSFASEAHKQLDDS